MFACIVLFIKWYDIVVSSSEYFIWIDLAHAQTCIWLNKSQLSLDDWWYVSNVPIIFDAPCLFLHHLFSVSLHFVAFLYIFWNKPINEMPQCQLPVFYCFCVSEMLHRKYSRIWTKPKPVVQIFHGASRRPKRRRIQARGRPHHRAARPRAGLHPLVVWAPWSTSDTAPSPIRTPRWEKPKHLITFLETHRDPPPSSTWDWEGPEALSGTLSERGIAIGGLLHRHACLRCGEWVVYLGLWVHSSS
jgi:hypothetical protein